MWTHAKEQEGHAEHRQVCRYGDQRLRRLLRYERLVREFGVKDKLPFDVRLADAEAKNAMNTPQVVAPVSTNSGYGTVMSPGERTPARLMNTHDAMPTNGEMKIHAKPGQNVERPPTDHA